MEVDHGGARRDRSVLIEGVEGVARIVGIMGREDADTDVVVDFAVVVGGASRPERVRQHRALIERDIRTGGLADQSDLQFADADSLSHSHVITGTRRKARRHLDPAARQERQLRSLADGARGHRNGSVRGITGRGNPNHTTRGRSHARQRAKQGGPCHHLSSSMSAATLIHGDPL